MLGNFTLLAPQPSFLQLSSTQTKSTFDPYFVCKLCKELVSPVGPLECTQCQSVFCQQCLETFIA